MNVKPTEKPEITVSVIFQADSAVVYLWCESDNYDTRSVILAGPQQLNYC